MKRWLNYAKPYWRYFIIGPLCMIVEVIGEVLLPALYSKIVDVGVVNHDVRYIIISCLLMILTAAAAVLQSPSTKRISPRFMNSAPQTAFP